MARVGYIFVLVQFGCLGLIALSGPLIPPQPLVQLLALAAVLLGVWSILVMRPGNLSVLPDVRPAAQLVTAGPYRLLRHPMYTAVLLFALALVLGAPTLLRGAVWAGLLVNMVLKLHYEELQLTRRFPAYQAYCRNTWRLLPFVY